MIPISQAIEIIKSRTSLLGTEVVPLSDVRGRILAEDIFADSDLPPFNRSQMDGFALRAADSQDVPARLRVVGESKAGEGWHQVLKEGEAVRIMTGAPLPEGADAVQKVEVTREADGFVEILEPVKPGQFINPLASEIRNGEMVFSAGQKINKLMIATLASFRLFEGEGCTKTNSGSFDDRKRNRSGQRKTAKGSDTRFKLGDDGRIRRGFCRG
jgi:molybdopterin molybdotransferase